jgi:F420-dependent oxidoreductase-like protein
VVEGWYGRPADRPLARTREYVAVIRDVLRRDDRVTNDGELYPLPYRGPGSTGLGKPLRVMTHPRRSDIPILLGAEGPKNVAQTAAIADGWLPLYYSPFRPEVYADQLAGAPPGFEVVSLATFSVTDDVAAGLAPVRAMLGFYIGGMGARGANYHANLMARMGYPDEAARVQELFLAGRRDEAVAAVPEDFADEISLVGPPGRIRGRLDEWERSPVTTLMVTARSVDQIGAIADLVAG